MNAARPYAVPVACGVLAALLVAALVVLVRTSAGPGRLAAEIGATATPPAMAGPGFGPRPGDDAGPGAGPGTGPGGEGGTGGPGGGIATLRTADFASNLLGGEIPASLGTAPSLTLAGFAFNDGLAGCAPGGLRGKARHLPAEMTWCDTGNAVHAPPLARTTESEWRDALELEASGLAPGDCPAQPVPASEGGPCVPARYTAACSKGVAVPDPQANHGLVRDCALLLLARDPLRGTAPLNWSEDLPIAEWDGVGVNGDPPRVDGVHLRNKGLDGVIPHWLGGLTELVHLHFGARNYLTGPIPPELANLSKLVQFYAGGRNALTGPIPEGLGDIRSLAALHLTGNRLTGVIPDLGGTNLSRLDLRGNELTGGIPEWLGGMTNLRVLSLRGNGLTGPIPRSIGRLPRLREVRLAQNALTGCVPSPLEDAAPAGWRNDVAELGLPWCLRYALDATGAVASAGSWAILDGGGDADAGGGGVSGQADAEATPAPPAVIATWEGLRSEAATLRVHQTDAGGTSWASEFGAVAEGDLFEWRKASDCWVRYRVTGPPVRPSAGSGRWEFPVEWMTYAATGEGCTGAVGSAAVLGADEAPPMVIPATVIDAPVRHGPWLLTPWEWDGEIEEPVAYTVSGDPVTARADAYTTDIAVAREFPRWREPTVPAGWRFSSAATGPHDAPTDGYTATYASAEGYFAATIYVGRLDDWPYRKMVLNYGESIHETRIIDGRWALVFYAPVSRTPGAATSRTPGATTTVQIFDANAGILYTVHGRETALRGHNVEPTIAIARSLLENGQ